MNRTELKLIHDIAERAVALYRRLDMIEDDKAARFAKVAIAGEIMTVHNEIVPLRLAEMLEADDLNLAHDIGGIHRHLDYGAQDSRPKLADCFMPRFAVLQ